MRKHIVFIAVIAFVFLWSFNSAMAQEKTASPHAEEAGAKVGGVKGLEQRIKHLEDMVQRKVEGQKWFDRINFSGVVEVDASYGKVDYDDPATDDETTSDVDLGTAELIVDARIADHVNGHVMFKYEDDDLFVDEGYILLTGSKKLPAYLIAGRQYLPFGHYDSHFVTDPVTLLLGETNEGAAVAGYRVNGDMLDFSVGFFNGKVKETGDDDTIDSFVASLLANPLESLTCGISYTSNLASADSLNEVVVDPDNMDARVAGWSAFIVYQFLDRFNLMAEYVGALDDFKAGELYDAADTKDRKPSSWNFELGFSVNDALEVAARYGGSDDGADFLPESEYGGVVNWSFFKNTNLAFEYLHGEYEDDVMTTDTLTIQLAYVF